MREALVTRVSSLRIGYLKPVRALEANV